MVRVMEWDIFLDCGFVETMSFLYTIIILKVGPLNYNILTFLFYMVSFFENWYYKLKINITYLNIENFYMMSHLYGF